MDQQSGSAGRGARLFGHPLHPMLTDLPIALWLISLLADLAALWQHRPIFRQFALWNIAIGLIASAPTIVAGLIDFAAIPPNHPALKAANWHMWIMLSAASAYGGSLIARLTSSSTLSMGIAIGLSALGLGLLLVGGWFGGEMVFRYGLGSGDNSSPKST
ncbi:MAG TPA: DUF2231 domain-containing protein [Candidatus Acidoferrum sp.]|nr:DUF2231 domain-containing protein [Candidatus Acidoferrum sp.]